MDGTLLDDNKKLSGKDIQSIRKLQDIGVMFAIATGRHDSMIKSYLKHLDLKVPVISCNGAVVREPFSRKVFLSQAIPKEPCLQVIDMCREKNAVYHIYGHDRVFGERLTHRMKYYHNLNKTLPQAEQTNLALVEDCRDVVLNGTEPLYKFIIFADGAGILRGIMEDIARKGSLTVSQSAPMLCDVMKKGTSKALALHQISGSLGIKRAEIAAIGDQCNDIDLIEYAGLGIAVANAEPALKEKADMVTAADNNQDAVSEAIERIFKLA